MAYLTLIDMITGACKIRFFKLHCLCKNVFEIFFRTTWRKEEYGRDGYKNCFWNGEKHNILGFEHCSWTLLEGERPGLRSCFMLKAEIFSAFGRINFKSYSHQGHSWVIRKSLESHTTIEGVIRESLQSHQRVITESSESSYSHQRIIIEPSGSHQGVISNSSKSHQVVIGRHQKVIRES